MRYGVKRLYLKLGGACNLQCKHCHCTPSSYTLNEDIFPYILDGNFKRITFGGGEPLLYIDTIKKVVERMPKDMEYKIVTNGTLLTAELVDYFNEHNFTICFSYDGENQSRDTTYLQCWHELGKIHKHGLATLFSTDTLDPGKLFQEIQNVRKKYNLASLDASVWANFVHQTSYNENAENDREVAKMYCLFIAGQLELDMRKFKANPTRYGLTVLAMAFRFWIRKYKNRGVHCFNDTIYNLTASGDFLLCPYDTETYGNIYTGIDWDKIEARIPERCKTCELWESCHNTCVANVTDNECYISKVMHKHFSKLMEKYNITYEEIEEYCANDA